ncbi:VOC family protein [Pseudactinotalea terrae]|uniref:VOC family protein n=1 Tax=Pseudactinotalea terrae TaxID=1743262 RepID=UPI0012E2D6F8|nr:VOC family protein [Pseudactinotalea terrae]
MAITLHTTFLPHDDADAAKAFYRDLLGFEIRQEVGYNDMHWITVGPPEQPDVNLVLHPPGADPAITDDERRTITEMMAKGTFASMLLASEDLEDTFAKLEAGGADILQEPADQDWGVRDCAVRDPAGNTLRIQQAR